MGIVSFASKLMDRVAVNSVPPAVAGGSMIGITYSEGIRRRIVTHPLPQVVPTSLQLRSPTFEAKPELFL